MKGGNVAADAVRESSDAPDLDRFFAPRSIAIIGASPDHTKIRGLLLSLLRRNGFAGRIYPVNPNLTTIDDLPCFADVAAIGEPVDLAIIAIPAHHVLRALEDCVAAGVRHAVVISSGFAEEGGAHAAIQAAMGRLAKRSGMRVSGPNAEGFFNAIDRVAATFSPAVDVKADESSLVATSRRIGIVSQSGGIGFALYNRGRAMGLSFSYVVSTGNECDLTAADFFAHMIADARTDIVLLFLESIRDPRTFLKAAAAAAASGKPVIVVKIGRSGAGRRATASHTASMAGWDIAYEAVFRRYCFIVADDPDEAVVIAAAFATSAPARGDRIAIVTVSGGGGAWAADALAAQGLRIPQLPAALQDEIRAVIPSYGSAQNPVDVTAQAVHTGGLEQVLRRLLETDEVDLILVVVSLANEKRMALDAAALVRIQGHRTKPVLFYTYTLPSRLGRDTLAAAGLVAFPGLGALAVAIRHMVHRGTGGACTPACPAPVAVAAEAGAGLQTLTEYETRQLLRTAGIALAPERIVRCVEDIAPAIDALGLPLAMKIQSRAILHKTDAGGVRLNIGSIVEVRAAFDDICASVEAVHREVAIDGVLLTPMAAPGVEMIVGLLRDPTFGFVVSVGLGGVATEIFRDVAYRLAPVDEADALAMLRELRSFPLLDGFRGRPKADSAALARLIAQVSTFVARRVDCVELEFNPVIVHESGRGATIVDAMITLQVTPQIPGSSS